MASSIKRKDGTYYPCYLKRVKNPGAGKGNHGPYAAAPGGGTSGNAHLRQLKATVPVHIQALAIEQARIDGLNTSAWLGEVITEKLRELGTTLTA